MSSILVNGINISWKNISFVGLGVPFITITELSYDRKLAKKDNYGIGQNPTSRGYGNNTYNGSVTILTDEIRALTAASPNKSILNIPPFSVQIIFDGAGGSLPSVDTIKNVEFLEDPFSATQGTTGIYCKIPIIFAGLEHL